MKPNAFDHPKTETFADELGVKLREAWGMLDRLFGLTQQYAPRGDIGSVFTNKTLAKRLRYIEPGEDPYELVRALEKSGFLDRHPAHRFVVHDWPEHAPEYIKRDIRESGKGWAVNDGPDGAQLNAHDAQGSGEGVYFVRSGNDESQPVKIGYSKQLRRRITHLRTTVPNLEVLGVALGKGRAYEKQLHRRFSDDCVDREWFKMSDGLQDEIDESDPFESRDAGQLPGRAQDTAQVGPSLPFHTSPLLSSPDPEDSPRVDPYRLPPDSPTLTPKQVRDLIATKPNGVVHTEQDVACWFAHKHPQMVARRRTDFAKAARTWFPNAKPGEVNESKEWVKMVNARASGERLKAEEAARPPPPEYSREELEALADQFEPKQRG